MEQLSSIRFSKLYYSGLPILFLVLYVIIIPSPSVSKIHLQDNLGYVAEGYDFTILNLSSPSQITRISSYTLPYWVENFTVDNRLAYVITGDNSIHIIDIRDLPNPKKLGEWKSPGVAHSIAISGGFAYVASHSDGVRILSVNDPSSPHAILHINNLGTVLDAATSQNLIYLARGPEGLDIYDTSSITKSESRGHYEAGGSINQITLLPENTALLMVDNNKVQIIDIRNLQNIVRLNSFTFDFEIRQAILSDSRIILAQENAGLLIAKIKNDGNLEAPINFIPQYNIQGVASVSDTVFIAAGVDGVQAINVSILDPVQLIDSYSRFFAYKLLIGGLVVAALLFWLAFFAQFVLPVRTFIDRQKIFYRLLIYLFGTHGPAIFVRNGVPVQRQGEEEIKGPGVLWLDSASAAVIRTAVAIKRTIGPGVHFIEKGEYMAGIVDLHTQSQPIGPKEADKPFDEKKEGQSEEEYYQVQSRRQQVSALTRDGIEVIPNISVTFRVNTGFPEDDQSGSRFGYRAGNRKRDKENEETDRKAIEKAIIIGEGINPDIAGEKSYRRVAWNKLPALMAVDLWREYLAKFTLDELFDQRHELPSSPPVMPQPTEDEISALNQPIRMGAKRDELKEGLASMLRELTKLLTLFIKWLDGEEQVRKTIMQTPISMSPNPRSSENKKSQKRTALQMINYMVKARMTLPNVNSLDEHGRLMQGKIPSKEYELLNRRGIKVLNVSIINLQFDKRIEDHFRDQWTANWLSNAKAERDQIDRRRSYVEVYGQEQAICQYAETLSLALIRKRPSTPKETLRTLVLHSWFEIMSRDQLLRKMATEKQYLEDIIKWLEMNDP